MALLLVFLMTSISNMIADDMHIIAFGWSCCCCCILNQDYMCNCNSKYILHVLNISLNWAGFRWLLFLWYCICWSSKAMQDCPGWSWDGLHGCLGVCGSTDGNGTASEFPFPQQVLQACLWTHGTSLSFCRKTANSSVGNWGWAWDCARTPAQIQMFPGFV